MGDLTKNGESFVTAWKEAQKAVSKSKHILNRDETALANAEIRLGKWLRPDDAKPKELFSVWHGNELITCEVLDMSGDGTYKIGIRKRYERK